MTSPQFQENWKQAKAEAERIFLLPPQEQRDELFKLKQTNETIYWLTTEIFDDMWFQQHRKPGTEQP